jgi:hypothetical protein
MRNTIDLMSTETRVRALEMTRHPETGTYKAMHALGYATGRALVARIFADIRAEHPQGNHWAFLNGLEDAMKEGEPSDAALLTDQPTGTGDDDFYDFADDLEEHGYNGERGAGAMSEKEEKEYNVRFVVVADMTIRAEDEEAACKKFLAEYRDDEAASVVYHSWQLDLGVIGVESGSDFNAGGRFDIKLPQGGAWVGRPTRERPNELCFMNDDDETPRYTFKAEKGGSHQQLSG